MKKTLIAVLLVLFAVTSATAQGPYKLYYDLNKYWAENGTIRTDGRIEAYGDGRAGRGGVRLYYSADVSGTFFLTSAGKYQFGAGTAVSGTEIGYLSGVTSAIQTQLGTKAPSASPSFTGTVTLPTGLTGYVKATAGVVSAGAIADGDLPSALTGKTYTGLAASEADFDVDEVKSTGISGYGLVMVAETSGKLMGVFRLDGDAIVSVSANSAFSVSKDTGSKINVYYETDQVKVQNKIASGAIETVSVVAAGADYLVDDVLTLADGTSGTVTVASISGDAHVDAVSITTAGLGYTTGIKATTVAPAGGTGCTIEVTAVDAGDGHVDTVSVSDGGLGYAINDVLTLAGGVGGDCTVTVTAIDKGHVTGVTLTAPGTGYTVATHATTGGTGSGCTIGVTAIVGLAIKIAHYGITI